MERSHVIFGYSTEDAVKDINRTANTVTGRINPKNVKCLVKTNKKRNIKRK